MLGTIILFGILAFLASPFVGFGLRRLWIPAVVVWACLLIYAAYVWTAPVVPDEGRLSGLWRMIVVTLLIATGAGFAFGWIISAIRASRARPLSEEGIE